MDCFKRKRYGRRSEKKRKKKRKRKPNKNPIPVFSISLCLRSEDTGTTDRTDLLLRTLREELGADNNGLLREVALAEHLEEAGVRDVDHGDRAALLPVLAHVLGDQRPQTVQVHRRHVVAVVQEVELAHAVLAKVAGVVAVKQRTVVVLATSVTATSGVLTVLDDATVTHLHVATQLPRLPQTSRHCSFDENNKKTKKKQTKNTNTEKKTKTKKRVFLFAFLLNGFLEKSKRV